MKRNPLYYISVGVTAAVSALGVLASLLGPLADRLPMALAGTLGLLICALGLLDGPPAELADDE